MPDQHSPRYVVVAPAQEGTHAQSLGWTVRDTATSAPDHCPWSPCTGDERTVRRYARAMNRRVREAR